MSAIVSEPGNTVAIMQRRRTDVSWGAIFAGWVLAYGAAWLLFVLGSAIGFSAIGFSDENIAEGLSWSSVAWIIVTWAVSMYLGGLFSAWLTGNPDRSIGGLHGVAVWALGTLLGLALTGLTAANVLQASHALFPEGMLSQLMSGGAQRGQSPMLQNSSTGPVATALQAQIKQALSAGVARSARAAPGGPAVPQEEVRRAVNQLDPATLATITGQLMRGDTEAATNTLVINTPLSRAQIDEVMRGMQITVQQLQEKAKQTAEQAAKYSAAVLWTVFISSAIGLIAATWGGWVGTRRAAERFAYVGGDTRRRYE